MRWRFFSPYDELALDAAMALKRRCRSQAPAMRQISQQYADRSQGGGIGSSHRGDDAPHVKPAWLVDELPDHLGLEVSEFGLGSKMGQDRLRPLIGTNDNFLDAPQRVLEIVEARSQMVVTEFAHGMTRSRRSTPLVGSASVFMIRDGARTGTRASA
jgi:hypothetical protein